MKIRRFLLLVAVLLMTDARAVQAQCTYSVTPTTLSVLSTGTSRTLSVITGTMCSWTATSTASWLTITSGASDTGLGSVVFAIAPNTSTSPRTGTLLVAGYTITVNQGAASCSYSVTPTSFSVGTLESTNTISVTTGTLCTYTATVSVPWITITSGATGSGLTPVTFRVDANPTGPARTGTIGIGDKTVTVNQAGGPVLPPATPTGLRIVG